MFKTVFSNLKMMINTSTFSKRLIIFLVYYLTIISTVRGIVQDPQDDTGDNIVIERCIAFPRHTFADVLTEDNDDKGFKIKILSFAEKVSTVQEINETMSSIQLGIKVQILDNKIQLTDSSIPEDSKESSAKLFKNWHDPKTYTLLPDFTFSVFAPYTFHYCRNLFGITSTDYVASFCDSPLRELSNPGASKSIFYLTPDDKFIMKTVQQTEDECFLRMLKKYTTYLTENRESLLPKFSAFFSFECRSIENKLVSMNNLIPSALKMHQKFDLKGSTLGREASSTEKGKKSPTYKDLDFRYELHPRGLFLKPDTRLALLKTLEKDCALLKEYNIMDYSILMGIYNIDHPEETKGDTSLNKLRLAAIARWEKLMADADRKTSIRTSDWTFSDTNNTSLNRGIPAKDVNGNRLLLFVGIIDILQTYRTTKSLERNLKSFKLKITPGVTDTANSISVQPPEFYASRFLKFMTDFVFKPMLSPEDLRKLAQQPIETRPSLNKSNSTMNSFKLIKDCLK